MATLYTQQDSNVRKTWFLITIFLVVIIGVGFVFSRAYDNPAILYIAIVFSLVMNFASYWWSDKIVLSMTGARLAEHDTHRDLYHVVENLAITAGLPMPKVYIIEDLAPNAFATGRDKNHAVVAVTSGLLGILNKTELEGVIAHELSHIKNYDIRLMMVVIICVSITTLLANWFFRFSFFGDRRSNRNNGSMGLIFILLGIVMAILSPLAAKIIQLSISRKREFLADASAALLTRYPEGLARALEKIAANPQPMIKANKAIAHLYFSSSFGAKKGWFSHMFSTHPPIEERVNALRQIA